MTGSQWATPIFGKKRVELNSVQELIYYPELLCCRDEGWSIVEYGHIFAERPGVYTKEQLLAWKQLESYNYFHYGYVGSVRI